MFKRKPIVYLLLAAFLFQIGCGSTRIPYPIDEKKSENDIKRLNYLGGRLSSTIQLNDSSTISANWLNLKGDRIYFLTNNIDDPPFVDANNVNSIRFYDWRRGCLGGGMFSIILGSLIFGIANLTKDKSSETNYSFVPIVITVLSLGYGIYALGEIEFSFIHSNPE